MRTCERAKAMTAEELDAALGAWMAGCDNRFIVAAVTLVREHQSWLYRSDFRERCVVLDEECAGQAFIRWTQVREFLNGGVRGSTSEINVLKFACSLAWDEFGWSGMGRAHGEMLLRAVTTALGGRG